MVIHYIKLIVLSDMKRKIVLMILFTKLTRSKLDFD